MGDIMIKKVIKWFKELKRNRKFRKKLKELKKRDPFIYK